MEQWSPIGVDMEWDRIDDETKFRLWNWASSALFYGKDRYLNREDLIQELSSIMRDRVPASN